MDWSGGERLHRAALVVRRYGNEKDFSPRCVVGIGDGIGGRPADQPSLCLDTDWIGDRHCPFGKADLAEAFGERTTSGRKQTVKIWRSYGITRTGINVNTGEFE